MNVSLALRPASAAARRQRRMPSSRSKNEQGVREVCFSLRFKNRASSIVDPGGMPASRSWRPCSERNIRSKVSMLMSASDGCRIPRL